MRRIPRISALMTAFPWHLPEDTPVQEARRFMQEHEIHHLPVTDDGHRVVGLVHAAQLLPASRGTLADWMVDSTLVAATERADRVLELMSRRHLPLVVLTHRDRLAGIFTWTDACRQFASWLREPFRPGGGDEVA